jgi:hypothetical protein
LRCSTGFFIAPSIHRRFDPHDFEFSKHRHTVFTDDSMTHAKSWQLTGTIGALTHRCAAGRVDVSQPHRGLHDLRWNDRVLPGHLNSVRRLAEERNNLAASHGDAAWPLAVNEAYVRDADLVTTYNESADWPYAPQIYWSAGTLDDVRGVIASLSIVASVQTHLLDTWPRIGASSQLDCEEVVQLNDSGKRALPEALQPGRIVSASSDACCILRRLTGGELTYVEIMPASDFHDVSLSVDTATGEQFVTWTLFSEFMEKGVIRRARLVSAFVPRANDVEVAATCCDAVLRSPLPLTT